MERKDTYYLPRLQQTVEAGEFASERDVEIQALKKLHGKNNNAFIMGLRALNEPISPTVFDSYVEKKKAEIEAKQEELGIEAGSSVWEAVKGGAIGAAKGPYRFAGHLASTALPLIAKTATTLYAASGAAGDPESVDKFVREWNKGINAYTNEIRRITGIDDASLVENILGGGISSAMVGVAGGGFSAAAFGLSAGQDTYVRQREDGVGTGESLLRAVTHGTAETALEKLQINRIWGALAKKSKPFKILKDIVENSAQEMAQSGVEMATNWNVDKKTLGEVAFELGVSAAGGAVGAGAGHVGGHVLNKKTINKVGDLMKKTGHSDEEIQNVKKELNKLVDTDELQRAANEVMKDELTTIALTYKEQAQVMSEELVTQLEDTITQNELVDLGGPLVGDKTEGMPAMYQLGELKIDTAQNPHLGMVLYQAEQAGQPMQNLAQVLEWTKNKLDLETAKKFQTGTNAVYMNAFTQLKGIGQDDNLANANANIRSAMAFSLARKFDMTPEEADNMLGGIMSQRASEFQGNNAMAQFQEVAQRINEIDAEEQANGVPEYTAPTININGVERQTTNSDGNPIAKSEKSLRYFYNWFGDSKVVDGQGRPLVVYHGSDANFDVFDKSKIGKNYSKLGGGFYFTNQQREAKGYGKTFNVYISLKNPINITNNSKNITKEQRQRLIDYLKNDVKHLRDNMNSDDEMFLHDLYFDINYDVRKEKFGEALKNVLGVDGIVNRVATSKYDNNLFEYVAFNPNQIKSVDNRGTFDTSNPNIYWQNSADFNEALADVIQAAKDSYGKGTTEEKEASFLINPYVIALLGKHGFNTKIYRSDINTSFVNHSIKKHGNPQKEEKQGQIAVNYEDFLKVPDVVNAPDYIVIEEYADKTKALLFVKNMENNTPFIVEIPSSKRKRLLARTMYKKGRAIHASDLHSLNLTSKNVPVHKTIIDVKKENVNPLLQSAFAGSRVDYDKPSLEAIGSGEGNQAHGWGLYYALNRDVAEGYRDYFVGQEQANPSVDNIWINGKKYRDIFKTTLSDVLLSNFVSKPNGVIMDSIETEIKDIQSFIKGEHLEGNILNNFKHDIKQLKKLQKDLMAKKASDIFKIEQGQVHEVDIPENPYLLDEDLTFNEQPEFVKEKLKEVLIDDAFSKFFDDWGSAGEFAKVELDDYNQGMTGGNIYDRISDMLGSDREASTILEKHGIKGITYVGDIDGRCFVIFNPDDVKVIQKFYQNEANPRGAYYNNTVYLFETADESTFIHEMSHAYMYVLERLAQGGNTKAQKDLDKIRKWLNKKEGDAFTVADWERFARGFEMYVREGKAPNEYLGGKDGVFARFKHWLLSIYGGIKNLTIKNEQGENEEVKINPQIKRFYDEMLGGTDIDNVFNFAKKNGQALTVLENKLLELSDIQQKLAQERTRLVREMAENVIPETKWANVKDWGKNVWESMKETPSHILKSSSARLAKIDKRLGLLVQRVEQSQGLRIKRWADQVKPFYDAFNKLSAKDKAKVQFFLLNQQWGEVAEIVGQEETDAIHGMLEGIYKELKASGVEVGYRSNYFPRSVLDYDGLLKEMGLTNPSLIKQMEDAIGKDATPQEQAEWLDRHVMGFKGNVSINGNRNTKERKLDLITVSMAQYYKPSMETLVDYMQGMAKLLSMRDMFGRNIEYKDGNKENAEDTIGQIINNIYGEGKLTKKETDEVREVLGALYLPTKPSCKWLQVMRQYGYATKLSYSTTVRQFADIGMTMKVNGVLNTLNAIFQPDKRITLKELGIDPLGEEYRTSQKDIGGSVANFFTKWRGINKADELMKNTFLRSRYTALKELAKNPSEFHEKYDALFGDEVDTLIKDLNENKVSEPVKALLFHEISKIQPISRSAMPTAYLNHPIGRMFYMFKTFSLHRAEYIISELAEDFRTKNYKKAGKDIMADVAVIGWEGLIEILIAFLKYGFPALAGKAVFDAFLGSGLGVFGLNKHQAVQLASGKVEDFIQEQIAVGTPIDDIIYLWRYRDKDDKLIRAVLADIILEPLVLGPKEMKN